NKAGIESELETQLNYKRMYESSVARDAERFLERMLGVRAIVSVAAEIDFSQTQETRNTYDPDSKVVLEEMISNSKHDGMMLQPNGPAGTATNIPPAAAAANASAPGASSKTEQIDAKYGVSEKKQILTNPSGKLIRLSVAAIVDVQPSNGAATPDPNNPNAAPAAQGMTQQELEELLKSAVGYDVARNDEVRVTLRPLAPDDIETPVATGFVWKQWQPLVQYTSLGLAALLAFFIGMMLMKRMKPIVITETVGPGIPLADARRLAVLSEQAKANPDVVASILSAWLNEQDQAGPNPAVAAQGREAYRAAASDRAKTPPSGTSQTMEGKRAA
ncbi:MAG: flagellar M-ring protein FliF C-terminal domain-containing protein, partial [Planctomycetota bacterium]